MKIKIYLNNNVVFFAFLLIISTSNILFAENIGPFKIGMDKQQVKKIVGTPEKTISVPIGVVWDYPKKGLNLCFKEVIGKLVTIMIGKSSVYKTAKNIKVGDPLSKVKKLYGKPTAITYFTKSPCYDLKEGSITFNINQKTKTIIMITLTSLQTCDQLK